MTEENACEFAQTLGTAQKTKRDIFASLILPKEGKQERIERFERAFINRYDENRNNLMEFGEFQQFCQEVQLKQHLVDVLSEEFFPEKTDSLSESQVEALLDRLDELIE